MPDESTPAYPFRKPVPDAAESALEAREAHKFLLAKAYFDCREFDRCAVVFLPSTLPRVPVVPLSPKVGGNAAASKGKGKAKAASTPPKPVNLSLSGVSRKALFLALYAKYLSGEKRRDEESEMILGPADGGVTVNRELNGIAAALEQYLADRHAKGRDGGGWLEYLYGIVLTKGKNEDLAKEWLIRSVNIYPFNWGAWQELANLMNTIEDASPPIHSPGSPLTQTQLHPLGSRLPENIMSFIFQIYTSQELAQCTPAIHTAVNQVLSFFPTSAFLHTQRALLHYHSKDFEDSESIFSALLVSDPHRLDSLDHYSNVLYVLDNKPKLAFLAQLATQVDKFRPETCCIVGNYYSLQSEHEKAVMYFRRALTLDRNFLSAWTLMGHEYVEMKNTHAALESYRRAVDVNRKDYRAWYGMGQTYEVLEMHSYALFYYQRAASLRPFDAKIWMAVGACFARVGKVANAIRAYKRALVAGSYYEAGSSFGSSDSKSLQGLGGGVLDPESLYQIAVLYERLEEMAECKAYMELVLAQEEGTGIEDEDGLPVGGGSQGQGVGVTPTTSRARMWLAKYEFGQKNWQRAMELANELCQDGVEVEDAKALVRDIRARIESEREAGGVGR